MVKVHQRSQWSRDSERLSWLVSLGRKSVGRVHSPLSLHTRLGHILAEDLQDAFDPNADAIQIWDHALLLGLLVEAFLVPYLLAFQSASMEVVSVAFVLVALCEGVFAVDLYVQANTGYYRGGDLIRDKKLTARRYAHSFQFMLDIIAILPYQALIVGYASIVPKLLLLKLLRFSRFASFISSLDEFYSKRFVLLKLLKVLVSTVYVAHVLACIRYSFDFSADATDHWQLEASERSRSLHERYLSSLFWSVGIMTGLFEGELPHHSSELVFTIVVALCGFSVFTALCTTIFIISKCESGQTEAMDARTNQLIHVLSFHRVPKAQQAQAIEYLKRYYTDTQSNDREASKLLCPSIASDIQVELLRPMIAQMTVFSGCSDQFVVAVAGLLEMIALPSQTTLFSAGDYGDALYIVHSGVLAIIVDSVTVRDIRKGSCFGELSVFSSMPRTATVVSMTYVILYKLSRFHCDRLLEGYPACASLIVDHVQNVLDQLKKAEVMDEGKPPAYNAITTKPLSDVPPRAGIRRASVEAAFVAGASAVLKLLSRKGRRPSGPRRILSWLGRKNVVTPAPQPDLHYKGDQRMGLQTRKSGPEYQEQRTTVGVDRDKRTKSLNPYDVSQDTASMLTLEKYGIWRLLLLPKCIDQHSVYRMWWLLLLLVSMGYSWLMVPVQIAFPLWQRPSWAIQSLDGISNVGFLLNVALNFNLSFVVDSEKITDTRKSARRYLQGSFIFDLICALPLEYACMTKYGLLRLPRLLSAVHLKTLLSDVSHFIPLNSRRQLLLLGASLFMMFHVVTCIHFGISYLEGFNPNEEEAWISPISLCLRRLNATHLESCNGAVFHEKSDQDVLHALTLWGYSRSLYYAVGVLASPGKSVEPHGTVQLVAALVLMLSGFVFTAVVVDNVQKRFTASAYEQKEFVATSSRIQRFLRQQNAPLVIHQRVKSFLDYWWSAHRGAAIGELLADLPRSIRLDLLGCICLPVLQTLALLQGVRPVLGKLEEVLVENAKFILYGQREIVYRYGDYVTGLFFLLEGHVCVVENGGVSREVPRGFFFGTAALTAQGDGGYLEHVSASSGCIVLLVSREQLKAMELIFPGFKEALLALEHRLLNNKRTSISLQSQTDVPLLLQAKKTGKLRRIFHSVKDTVTSVHDPDSTFITMWEVWMFVALTVQWALVVFQVCFPLDAKHEQADALMLLLEFSFLLNMQIRSRLGFYEFGNKIMDTKRIKRRYFRSYAFGIDIAALLPLYIVNWSLPTHKRLNIVNVNKLLRLLKVPKQLLELEQRYLKHTTELRLFKLLYYTFMLSHLLGCIWFNFASKQAIPSSEPAAFGDNLWLPSTHVGNGSLVLQYAASLYWSFGLMSASSEPEFPKTTAQCTFSAFTMTAGFFLCAYVIGNFSDIIELNSAETRWFNAKVRAVRRMLQHFRTPDDLQQRVKTLLLFKRYHTVTQENLLVHYLSPSLLTDIRLIHLKPMLERVEFLGGMEGSITRMLVSQFTQILVSRGEFVCRFGERGSDMFFIFAGVVDVLLPSQNTDTAIPIANANWSDRISVHRRGSHSSVRVGPMVNDITRTPELDRRSASGRSPKERRRPKRRFMLKIVYQTEEADV